MELPFALSGAFSELAELAGRGDFPGLGPWGASWSYEIYEFTTLHEELFMEMRCLMFFPDTRKNEKLIDFCYF